MAPSCPNPSAVSLASLREHERVSARRLNETGASQTSDVTGDYELLHLAVAAIQRQSVASRKRTKRMGRRSTRFPWSRASQAATRWPPKTSTRAVDAQSGKTARNFLHGQANERARKPRPLPRSKLGTTRTLSLSCRELSLATSAVVPTFTWTVKNIPLPCNIEQVIEEFDKGKFRKPLQ